MQDYKEAVDYLYSRLADYQVVGSAAYKPNLNNITALLEFLGNPHRRLNTIHVAGTNGKGSSSHMIASILQESYLSTGLYTSPHLKAFTERIKLNGSEIEEDFVVAFVNKISPAIEKIKPSFF